MIGLTPLTLAILTVSFRRIKRMAAYVQNA
jgi:hypothetical protein